MRQVRRELQREERIVERERGADVHTERGIGRQFQQAAWLAQWKQNNVQIAGNADERGTSEYNIALGAKRANAARSYLVAKGVAATRISTISFGKDRPVALGSNDEAWSQNRNAITSVR